MNNSELIHRLDKDKILSVVELLSLALRYPNDDLSGFNYYSDGLPDEIFNSYKGLTEYERLKLMQLIINLLIHEAEQSTVRYFQTPWSQLDCKQ
jgi:hypothetical protein